MRTLRVGRQLCRQAQFVAIVYPADFTTTHICQSSTVLESKGIDHTQFVTLVKQGQHFCVWENRIFVPERKGEGVECSFFDTPLRGWGVGVQIYSSLPSSSSFSFFSFWCDYSY